ncbi:MAG: SpaA isopeptide-forming pilin-related protein [Oscillospiraceae bacterium]|nr:SpaA isopeptide-forming pilin-related protein [Oscillospiraceae bacterium]
MQLQKQNHIRKWTKTVLLSILIFAFLALPIAGSHVPVSEIPTSPQHAEIAPLSTVTINFPSTAYGSIIMTRIPDTWISSGSNGVQGFRFPHNGGMMTMFCLQPPLFAPPAGIYQGTVLGANHPITRAIFYLYGPGGNVFWTAERLALLEPNGNVPWPPVQDANPTVRGKTAGAAALVSAYLHAGRTFPERYFPNINSAGRAAISRLATELAAMPPVPVGAVNFTQQTLTAVPANGRLETPWTTLSAPAGATIYLPIQVGVTLELIRGGNITNHSGSIILQNGDSIRFVANTRPPQTVWESPNLYGSLSNFNGVILINQNATNSQTVGGIESFSYTWLDLDWPFESFGSLRIQKTVSNWHTVQGFRFNVTRESDNIFIGTFYSDESGWAYVPNLVRGYYIVSEVVPIGFVAPPPVRIFVEAGYTGEHSPIASFHNIRQQARIVAIKSCSNTGTRLPGAVYEFRYGSPVGEVLYTATTGEDGRAISGFLPFGAVIYVVEVQAPTGFVLDSTPQRMLLSSAYQAPVLYFGVYFTNQPQMGRIPIQKFTTNPALTVHHLGGAVFDIRDYTGNIVDTVITDIHGSGLSGILPLGAYTITERTANYGFIRNPEVFTVTLSGDMGTTAIVYAPTVYVPQQPVVGRISILKRGYMLTGAELFSTPFGNAFRPIFEMRGLPNAVFEIQDHHGNVLDTITTDENGFAVSRYLPLNVGGEYFYLVEVQAPHGFVIDRTPVPIRLDYAGQYVAVVTEHREIENIRQRANISLQKDLERPDNWHGNLPFQYVQFGLFARENIYCVDGELIIELGDLIEVFGVDENGVGAVESDLPHGYFFIRELATANGWVICDREFDVVFAYENPDIAVVEIQVNNGEPIRNYLMRGSLRVIKTFEGRDFPVARVPFRFLGQTVGGEVIIYAETNKNGEILLEGLLVGVWTVTELSNDTNVGFVLFESQTIEISADTLAKMSIHNTRIRGEIHVLKTCSSTTYRLPGATFGLFQGDIKFATATTNEDGVAIFENIPFGEFELRELYAPYGWVLSDEVVIVVISEHGAVVEISFENEPYVPEIPEEPKTPQTGEGGLVMMGLTIVGIIPIVIAMFILRRKKGGL